MMNMSEEKIFGRIRIHQEEQIKNGHIACSVSIVAQNNEIIWQDYSGYSNIEKKIPLKPNGIFRLASMTKPVVAAAVMQQYEKGTLTLETPVSRFIETFKRPRIGKIENGEIIDAGESGREILIVDLLTHSSGLGSGTVGDRQLSQIMPRKGDTLASIVPRFGSFYLDFEPQSQLAYSGLLAFDTLAHIVELTSGMPFPEYLQKYIFSPLGISDITFHPTEDQWARTVGMYAETENGVGHVEIGRHTFGNIPLSYTSGGGGLMGSCEDYYKFAAMLLNEGTFHGAAVLKPETVCLMKTPQQPKKLNMDWGEQWGLGMRVITAENAVLTKGSFGWSGAYGTHFWLDPVRKIAAVYCSNMTTANGAGAQTAREFERDVYESLA